MTSPTKNQPTILKFLQELNTFSTRVNRPLRILHSDNDTAYAKDFARYLRESSITWNTSAVYTPAQDPAERAGGMIVTTARSMRVASKLPQDMWPEIVKAAIYLLNRTPIKNKNWKTPFELGTGRKPQLGHLRIYGCRAYAHKLGVDTPPRLEKLAERAHVGYLVGWDSTNIYRIWVPSQDAVFRTRDVLFDEKRFYDPHELDLLHTVTAAELTTEGVIDFENDTADPLLQFEELESAATLPVPPPQNTARDEPPPPQESDGDRDFGDTYATPPLSMHGRSDHGSDDYNAKRRFREDSDCDPDGSVNDELMHDYNPLMPAGVKRNRSDRSDHDESDDHDDKRIRINAIHRIIFATWMAAKFSQPWIVNSVTDPKFRLHVSTMPKEPAHFGQITKNKFKAQWLEAIGKEFDTAMGLGTFVWAPAAEAAGKRLLPLKWVFKYKTDSAGYVVRFKARLCARGDLQATDQETYASTLAMRVFRLMCAIACHFDLEMIQMDAVNAYLNAKLQYNLFVQSPPGIFAPNGQVLLLVRALYGLKESGFLWQQLLQGTLESLGLHQVPGVECLFTDGIIMLFFFVDDMVTVYHRRHHEHVRRFMDELTGTYELKLLGDLKWYLGIKVSRNRETRQLWLSQEAYIEKIAAGFEIKTTSRQTRTPLPPTLDLAPAAEGYTASPAMVKAYQRRTGSIGYAALAIRPDVSHAASLLSTANHNPTEAHLKASDHCIRYLLQHKGHALHFGNDGNLRNEGVDMQLSCGSDDQFFGASDVTEPAQGSTVIPAIKGESHNEEEKGKERKGRGPPRAKTPPPPRGHAIPGPILRRSRDPVT